MLLNEFLVKTLEKSGCEAVFHIPGGAAFHLVDAVSKSKILKLVPCFHEQAWKRLQGISPLPRIHFRKIPGWSWSVPTHPMTTIVRPQNSVAMPWVYTAGFSDLSWSFPELPKSA